MNGGRLNDIVHYAYTKVPLYMEVASSMDFEPCKMDVTNEWEGLPLIKKNDMLLHRDACISIEHLPSLLRGSLMKVKTSGSTGKCLNVYWTLSDMRKSLMPLWMYRLRYYGVRPEDPHCYFYSSRNFGGEELEYEQFGNRLGFSKNGLNKEKLIRIIQKLHEFAPKWMMLQPSIAALLCQTIRENNLPRVTGLKYIELSSEILFDEIRREVEEVFHCKIGNQYGCFEANSIAYECNHGNMHCMGSNVLVEVLRDGVSVPEGEEGDIYITSLNNYAMPFIRYEIGDKGILHKGVKCACGNKEPILELTTGRNNDWILCSDGTKANPYIFVRAIENTNKLFEDAIIQFQIIQKNYDCFIVRIVLDEEGLDEDGIIDCFCDNVIQPSLRGVEYFFEFSNALFPDDASGKLRYFINDVNVRDNGV